MVNQEPRFCVHFATSLSECRENDPKRWTLPGHDPINRIIEIQRATARVHALGGADLNGEVDMTSRWILGATTAALTVAGAVAAQAADLPTRKEAPAPVFVPPPFTWTGFYVGLNAGGIWGTGNTQVNAFFPASSIYFANYTNNSLGTGASGFIGGGQAGYNYQAGAAVFGIETDFDGTSMSKSRSIIGSTFTNPGFLPDYFTTNASARMNWLGTTRARIGFVATPDNRLMFYGTGGVAYGGGSGHVSVYDFDNQVGFFGSSSQTRVGWTLGAGVEYAITNNITIKGEYLYYNLGSSNFTISPLSTFVGNPSGSFLTSKVNYEGSIFRAGVNYKF
jgi:outer membrane immunogenic protein